eukprot:scaffold24745_cov129-Isochrysis_galbana.AAC.1
MKPPKRKLSSYTPVRSSISAPAGSAAGYRWGGGSADCLRRRYRRAVYSGHDATSLPLHFQPVSPLRECSLCRRPQWASGRNGKGFSGQGLRARLRGLSVGVGAASHKKSTTQG